MRESCAWDPISCHDLSASAYTVIVTFVYKSGTARKAPQRPGESPWCFAQVKNVCTSARDMKTHFLAGYIEPPIHFYGC